MSNLATPSQSALEFKPTPTHRLTGILVLAAGGYAPEEVVANLKW